jgi:hypothetical protein
MCPAVASAVTPERVSGPTITAAPRCTAASYSEMMLDACASVRTTCMGWRLSAKESAAWQPRRTASDALENSGALRGRSRPMNGGSVAGLLAGSSTAAHNAGLSKADKAKQICAQ